MTSPLSSFHASNALTSASLMCGVGALAAALDRSSAGCGALLALAVVFDTFDGQFARRIRARALHRGGSVRNATLGGELDSLVDAIVFGAVPIVCASVVFEPDGLLWWGAAFAYVACVVTRLGFYNLTAGATSNAPDFIGLPSPVAALFWSSLFLFDAGGTLPIAVALCTALAMIAPLRIPRPSPAGLAAFVLWPALLLALHALISR
jgi:CDP-diacylglycerol--serine O-phosphatidyltransferase